MAGKSSDQMAGKAAIPAYVLYGDAGAGIFPDSVHAETIHARSSVLGWRIEPHRHHGLYQAMWISGGGAEVLLEGEARRVKAPGFVWIPPLVVHGYAFEADTTGVVVSIPAPTIARCFPKSSPLRADLDRPIIAFANPPPAPAKPRSRAGAKASANDAEARFLFETLLAEFLACRPGRDESLVSRAALLGLWFARGFGKRANADPAQISTDVAVVQRFLGEVEKTYTENRTMPDYARSVGVSLPHLGRLCRQVTGHSALKLLHERIVLEAKRSLVYTSLPVGEIALRLGFGDAAYFSRFFRERTGKSPQAFRALAAKAGGA